MQNKKKVILIVLDAIANEEIQTNQTKTAVAAASPANPFHAIVRMMLPIARIVAASCASTLTACALWGSSIETSRASDDPFVAAPPVSLGLAVSPSTNDDEGIDASFNSNSIARLKACPAESNCVSSNYGEPPNRYFSPLSTFRDSETAFARAVQDLRAAEASSSSTKIKVVEVLPRQRYLHLTVPGTAAGSLDDIEIVFAGNDSDGSKDNASGNANNIVHLKCVARVTLPPPPFCLQKNCINGNMDQRRRLDGVSQILGLPSADQYPMQQSAKWSPIFFNADKVPGFDDEIEY